MHDPVDDFDSQVRKTELPSSLSGGHKDHRIRHIKLSLSTRIQTSVSKRWCKYQFVPTDPHDDLTTSASTKPKSHCQEIKGLEIGIVRDIT